MLVARERIGPGRRLSGVVALLAAIAAMASPTPAAMASPVVGPEAAVAVAIGDQPLDPAQLTLARDVVRAMDFDTSIGGALDIIYGPMRAQVMREVSPDGKVTPNPVFVAAVDEALLGGKTALKAKVLDGLTRYYAASLEAQSLRDLAAFLRTPLGRKFIKSPDQLTQADRREVNILGDSKPFIDQLAGVGPGSSKVVLAVLQRHGDSDVIIADFNVRLCAGVKARGLTKTC